MQRSIHHLTLRMVTFAVVCFGLCGAVFRACVESPTLNEPAHLAAGISNWEFGRFDVYRVNPPLVHMVSAVVPLLLGTHRDWGSFSDSPSSRSESSIGNDLFAANGTRSMWLVTVARWSTIPFGVVGGTICFLWSRRLFGQSAGVAVIFLLCFSPNLVAHISLATPDASASALGVIACYAFWRWLKGPSWPALFLAAIALGLALLAKFTLVILFGLLPLIWFVIRVVEWHTTTAKTWSRQIRMIAMWWLIAVFIINIGYCFEGSLTPVRDLQFISSTFTGDESGDIGNRFADTWLGSLPVPLPKNYVLGIDVQRRDFENFRYPSYLRSEWNDTGWWYYYVYGLVVKVPLGTWLLFLLCLVLRVGAGRSSISWQDELVLLVPPAVIFLLVSSQTGFSHHFRYVLPCFPFLFIWISQVVLLVRNRPWLKRLSVAALVWSITSSLWIYPHSLSYFNELTGGPRNGHLHLLHSSIDWGQDLLYLRRWMRKHPEVKPLHLAYYGYFDPRHIGVDYELPPQDGRRENRGMLPGWYAVSTNFLYGYPWRFPQDALIEFQKIETVATAGYSIHIYQVTREDANRIRRGQGLPEIPKDWRKARFQESKTEK